MRILYFMHIDWHWIKQRPQFLAEQLADSAGVELLVVYPYAVRRTNMVKNATSVKLRPLPMVPFSRFAFLQSLNESLQVLYLSYLVRSFKPDVLWVTFPGLVSMRVSARYPELLLVYDCMDDALAFRSDAFGRQHLLKCEMALLERADLVLTSSQNLLRKVTDRGACRAKVQLVRNAFSGNLFKTPQAPSRCPEAVFRILYFGTVADYIDFDTLLYCLRTVGGIEIHLVGPVTTNCPSHERLIFHDPVEHEHLAEFAQTYDCFVMPFTVTELIRGVDPVKLYEYINFNKNILSVYYPELERFADFVTFYKNKDEFVAKVKSLSGACGPRYLSDERIRFLISNSWSARAEEIRGYLNRLSARPALSVT